MVDDPLWDGSTSSRISRNLLILLAFLKYVHTNKHENTTHMRTMVQWCWNIYNYIYHKKMTQIYVKSSSTMEHRFIKPCHVENLRCCHRPSLEPLPLATWWSQPWDRKADRNDERRPGGRTILNRNIRDNLISILKKNMVDFPLLKFLVFRIWG